MTKKETEKGTGDPECYIYTQPTTLLTYALTYSRNNLQTMKPIALVFLASVLFMYLPISALEFYKSKISYSWAEALYLVAGFVPFTILSFSIFYPPRWVDRFIQWVERYPIFTHLAKVLIHVFPFVGHFRSYAMIFIGIWAAIICVTTLFVTNPRRKTMTDIMTLCSGIGLVEWFFLYDRGIGLEALLLRFSWVLAYLVKEHDRVREDVHISIPHASSKSLLEEVAQDASGACRRLFGLEES